MECLVCLVHPSFILLFVANLMEALKDPEVATAMQNPKMVGIFQDIMKNPGNINKYMSDPDFMNLYSKIMSKMNQ